MVMFIKRIFADKRLYLRPAFKISIRNCLESHCVLTQEQVSLGELRQLVADTHWRRHSGSARQEVCLQHLHGMCACSGKCCCHYTIFTAIKFHWGQLGTTRVEMEQQISKFDPSFLGCQTPCPSAHMASSPLASELDLPFKKWVTGKNSLVGL